MSYYVCVLYYWILLRIFDTKEVERQMKIWKMNAVERQIIFNLEWEMNVCVFVCIFCIMFFEKLYSLICLFSKYCFLTSYSFCQTMAFFLAKLTSMHRVIFCFFPIVIFYGKQKHLQIICERTIVFAWQQCKAFSTTLLNEKSCLVSFFISIKPC